MNISPLIVGQQPSRPYPGLRAFEADEWSIFFGRERMIDEVIEHLAINGLVLIHGASGSGKSSLVRAGVMPKLARQHLRRGAPWMTCTIRPSGGPLWNLAAEFARLEERADDIERIGAITTSFNARGASLSSIVSRLHGLAGKRVCILVDQFEELFRYEKQGGREEVEVFVDLLKGLTAPDEEASAATNVHVVVTMRSEFLGECARFDGLAETINQTQYLVPRMEDDALMRAVRRPAELYAGFIDEDLALRLIISVRGRVDELPLLQHGLMMMWDEAAKRTPPGERINLDDDAIVTEAGGLAGLLSGHADSVMNAVAPDEARKRIVENVFRELTDVNAEGSAIRRPRRFADLAAATGASPEELEPILDAFRAQDATFLTPYVPAPIDAKTEIDISHEALIRCWRRVSSLKDGWLRQEFDDGLAWRSLLVEARAFEKHKTRVLSEAATKDRGELYAARNEPWSQRYGDGWGLVGSLLEASRQTAARARRVRTATMASIFGLCLIALVFAAAMGAALRQEKAAAAAEQTWRANVQKEDVLLQDEDKQLKDEDAKLKEALQREKEQEGELKAALHKEEGTERLLTESNEQAESQNNFASVLVVLLTDSGKNCPNGITPDENLISKAFLAAARHNGNASFLLGMLFQCGLGEPRDTEKAREWYEKAAGDGNTTAMWLLGIYYEEGRVGSVDLLKAREWYEKGAAAGDGKAMTNLGFMYEVGHGVEQNYAKAIEYYERAAEAGNNIAMRNVGTLYRKGNGAEQNYKKAMEWYKKAAEAANGDAMVDLALLYEKGQGTEQNYKKAMEWYEKAADTGKAAAKRRMAYLYLFGKGEPRDLAKARELLTEAAEEGVVGARFDLSDFDFLPKKVAANDARDAGKHDVAARLEAELVRDIEADERRHEGKSGTRTARMLSDLAWDALFIHDFTHALDASVRGHKLAPDDLVIEENHAHSLMFLGRQQEARDLYLSHNAEVVREGGTATWKDDILQDFADFRKADMTDSLMQEIETELTRSAK